MSHKTNVDDKFMAFQEAALKGGALDAKTKYLLSIAASLGAGCDPCLQTYLKKAHDSGATQEGMDEC